MSPNRAVANPALLSAFWLLAAWALPASGVKARHVNWLVARPATWITRPRPSRRRKVSSIASNCPRAFSKRHVAKRLVGFVGFVGLV